MNCCEEALMDYTGIYEASLSNEELADFYESDGEVLCEQMVENQYLTLRAAGSDEVVDYYQKKDGVLRKVPFITFSSRLMGCIKPKTFEQRCAMDLLQNRDITVKIIRGVYGSGKDHLMSAYATQALESGIYSKIIYIRPSVSLRDVPETGYLKGSIQDKLGWTLGPLYDKLGGEEGVQMMIDNGQLELTPLQFIRGRSFENCLIYVSEGQNITTEVAKLLIGRVGENSALFINGDTHQTDNKIYDRDNGVLKMIERLRGNELFGYVYLSKTLRSPTANLANLLDD